MAEIIPSTTSGAAISQGQGQGYAQVFGQSSFDPVAFVSNVAAKQEARRQAERDEELKMRERNAKVAPFTPESGLHNEEEIYKLANDANEEIAKMQMAGIDIMGSPEGRRIYAQTASALKSATNADKYVTERLKHFQDLRNSNPGKYSQEDLNKYYEQIGAVKGVMNKARYAEEHSPFPEPEYDLNKPQMDLAKTIAAEIIEKGDTTITSWPREKVAARVNTYLNNMPTDELQAYYETGKKKGYWTDGATMRERTVDDTMTMAPYEERKDEPRSSGGGGGITLNVGGGMESEKFRVTPAFSPDVAYGTEGENNVITINSTTGAELKPMEFRDASGNLAYIKVGDLRKGGGDRVDLSADARKKAQPLQNELDQIQKAAQNNGGKFTADQEKRVAKIQSELNRIAKESFPEKKKGNKSATWFIEGTKAKRVTGEQAKALQKELGMNEFLGQYQEVEGEPGTYISITENEPISVPISSVKGRKGYDNYQKLYGITGVNFGSMMNESATAKSSGKNVSSSQIKELVGKPGYEGYTEQELIDYYKSQGYTIE